VDDRQSKDDFSIQSGQKKSIHHKDAKKTTLLWRLIPLNIFFAVFAPLL
jgi:hypothetical protein